MYKGALSSGSKIVVTLQSNGGNRGSALLAIAYEKSGGGGNSDSDTVAPGGSGDVTSKVDGPGWLRILVDMNSDADTGRLTVAENGAPVTAEAIKGDTTWTYTVV